jgi:hypothetical protein
MGAIIAKRITTRLHNRAKRDGENRIAQMAVKNGKYRAPVTRHVGVPLQPPKAHDTFGAWKADI